MSHVDLSDKEINGVLSDVDLSDKETHHMVSDVDLSNNEDYLSDKDTTSLFLKVKGNFLCISVWGEGKTTNYGQ